MNFNYSQIFLLVWLIAFWICSLGCGKARGEYEKSIVEEYGKTRSDFIFWIVLHSTVFILCTALILIYFFCYESVNWFCKISLLDNDFVKIFAMIIMCFTFLLNTLFTLSIGKSVKVAVTAGETPKLVTTGIYRYIRHPGYLGFYLAIFGTFLIIPNLFTLTFFLYAIVVIYIGMMKEEKIMLKMYGDEYEDYKSKTGRFLPKLKGVKRRQS